MPLAVRSGGHGLSTNDGGIVLDLGRLREVQVARQHRRRPRRARRSWGEVARSARPPRHGADAPATSSTSASAGSHRRRLGLSPVVGLTIDRVRAVDVVLADGTLVRADDRQHADLLWAVRGAGGGFGVVTAFEFEADPIGDVTSAESSTRPPTSPVSSDAGPTLVEDSPRDLSSFLYVQAQPGAGGLLARATVVDASGDARSGRAAVAPFADVAPIVEQACPSSATWRSSSPRDRRHRPRPPG